jgi:tetratricopeptide (TPR) repeat protein
MPTVPGSELPVPKSWDEFEDIVWDLYSREWDDPHAQRYGVSGQAQQGVDIYGQPARLGGAYAGVQCKRCAEARLTRANVEEEVAKAERFSPLLAEYVIATTEPRDAKLQQAVREMDRERSAAAKFPVRVVFWEDLCSRLCDPRNSDLLLKHYRDWLARLKEAAGAEVTAYIPPMPPEPDELPEPGALPPGSRVVFARNELFTGREDALKGLTRGLLHEERPSTLVTQAVAGMGGVGKTQLAVEFAYRYGRFFHGVHWINAAQPAAIGAEVAACGERMCLPHWPEKQPEQVSRTLDAWRRGGRRLVVLDNLEEVETAREWLARLSGGGARVLVTARRSDWPRDLGMDPLRLEVFTPEESRAFLRRYLAEERATDGGLASLAERLGHLPLALELAGRYLAGLPRVTVETYLEKLDEVWAHPSMRNWREELGSPTGHDLGLAATFAVSWERVEDEAARRVFLMAGWCAPNELIPCGVLEKAVGLDTEGCDEAVRVLAGLGLVEVEDLEAGPVVHPLLAEYGRAVATAEGGETGMLGAVAEALGTVSYEALNTGLPARFAPLRPHVEAVARAAEGTGLEKAGSLLNDLSVHLRRVADYAGSRAAIDRALAIDERAFGPEHPKVAIRVNNLGSVLRAQGDLEGARAAFERALAIDERVYGQDHANVAIRVNNLGSVLRDQGDLEGARAAFERALAIDEQVYGPEHPEVATDVNNLGRVLYELGEFHGARAAIEQALAIDERVYGPEHPSVARDVNNLGLVLQVLGDLQGARVAIERALAIDERVFGPEHPNVARDVNNLGLVLRDLGDLAGARAMFERALVIDERVYGPEHPKVGMRRGNLGKVLRVLGDLDNARKVCEQALRIFQAAHGQEHPHVATASSDLGNVLLDLGDLVGARAAFERALAIFAKFLPEGHPSIETVQGNLEGLGEE